ncbi:MAG: glycosyltransferase family 4 protein [Rhodothermales bacterium]|nr:glycosyltransferase family 4 protein [Rhodothermales bacterium]
MKAVLVNADDGIGGAARACYRLHRGLLAEGVEARMLVRTTYSDDETVSGPRGFLRSSAARLRPYLAGPLLALHNQEMAGVHSINALPTGMARRIAAERADIVHLHLLSKETISIAEVGRIAAPVVWTLHDMWTFCGTEHYTDDGPAARFRTGYTHGGTAVKRGFDLDRWTWKRKRRHWATERMTVVTPSRWMAECARSSALFRDATVEVIPNGVDTRLYKPLDRAVARDILNLPADRKLVLFGAMRATSDRRKGFRFLEAALRRLAAGPLGAETDLVVFGATAPATPDDFGLPAHYTGRVSDDISLALLYAAADVFVAPSQQDNLPNTVVEALACGTPCVAFRIGGMPEMIAHQENGYLAEPFDTDDLAAGLAWVLEDAVRAAILAQAARRTALASFTIELQARDTAALYRRLI